jgi:hypothetical protein
VPPSESLRAARKEIADYLRAHAPPLQKATEAQRQWSKALGPLYEQATDGKGAITAARARALGKTYTPIFRQCLAELSKLEAPQPATRYQEYLVRWLKSLINASDSLTNAPDDGRDVSYLRDCHDFLDDARYAVKPLTEIREKLYEAARGPAASAPPKKA